MNSNALAQSPVTKAPFLLTLEELQTTYPRTSFSNGLKAADVQLLRDEFGSNELEGAQGTSALSILAAQIFNPMNLVVLLATASSLGIGSFIEGGVLVAVVILNVGVGFYQYVSLPKGVADETESSPPRSRWMPFKTLPPPPPRSCEMDSLP